MNWREIGGRLFSKELLENVDSKTAFTHGPRDYHIKWSKSLICGILKMIQMNLFIKQKQTHRHRKQADGYQRGKEPGKTN